MGRPVTYLALPWAIPNWLTLWATFVSRFFTLFAFETLQQTFNIVIGVQISQPLHLVPLTLIHTLTQPYMMILSHFLPIFIMTNLSGNDGYLLNHKRISTQVCWYIHDGKFLQRPKHMSKRWDLIQQDFIHKLSELNISTNTLRRLPFLSSLI